MNHVVRNYSNMSKQNQTPGVTIFYINSCPHCVAAKTLLKSWEIPFNQINVEHIQAEKWAEIKHVTKRSTVPQLFLNGHFLGGNKELQEKRKSDIEDSLDNFSIIDIVDGIIEEIPEQLHSFTECHFDEDIQILGRIKESGVLKSNKVGWFKKIGHAVSEKKLILWMRDEYKIQSDNEAKDRIMTLVDKSLLAKLVNDGNVLYQPIQFSHENALNASITPGCIPEKSKIGEIIRSKIVILNSKFISPDGKSVDYVGMKNSQEFQDFKQTTALLQTLDLSEFSSAEILAFFINIYNSLVIHGYVQNGIPETMFQRISFYKNTSYIIGENVFSLDDIENGVLRGNKRAPANFSKNFGKNDDRLNFVIPGGEPMIHFALNCGAESCPPIKMYKADGIKSQLNLATQAFFEDSESLTIVSDYELKVSKILDWYKVDFGGSPGEVGSWILKHLDINSEKYDELSGMVKKGSIKKITYWNYSWATNSKK